VFELRINHASESAGHLWSKTLDFDEDAGTSAIDYAALDEAVNQTPGLTLRQHPDALALRRGAAISRS
jgi:hypothetical protein